MARPERFRLGDLLVQQGLLTDAQIGEALAAQKTSGRKLGRVLIDKGWVNEVQIASAIAKQLRVPFVDVSQRAIRTEVARLLPEVQARRLRAIVIDDGPAGLRVGMTDPADIAAYDDIARLLRRDFELVVVAEAHLLGAIERSYRHTDEIVGLARQLTTELSDNDSDLGDLLGLSTATTEDAPVARLLMSVFEEALRIRASDIHIEPMETMLRIRFRIDGVLQTQTEADSKVAAAVALRLKLMSGLDISEKRLPQDGRFAVKLRGGTVDVRISTMPTQYGESVVMRLLAQNHGLLSLSRLNLPAHVNEAVGRAIHRPSGLVLVTGPTGSGKTTTLYAALNALNSDGAKIITVEDPVEYRMPGLNQVQVHDKIDLSFDRVLRAALRQDPDIILVGEMRDQKTAEIGLRAALTGHLVLSTLHTNDAISTPLRLLDMGVPKYMVAMALQLVLAQRLVRVLCTQCAEPQAPSSRDLVWLQARLGPDIDVSKVHTGIGCGVCNSTGFAGRTGVYEFVEMNQELIECLGHGSGNAFEVTARRQMAGNTLGADAARLVLAGRTTVEEAMRVDNAIGE